METEKLKQAWRKATTWARTKVPPGVRTLLGLLLIAGGVLGFLPILGFWMIPLGIVMISFDVTWAYRKLRGPRDDR